MTNYKRTIAIYATLIVLGAALSPVVAGIKCWTNNEGVKECGNVVPPEYSQEGHEELSAQGVTVKKTARAKTIDELAEEDEANREQVEQERLSVEQASKDRVLVDTFTTEEDLILTHDGKLLAIDSRITHTKQVADSLEKQLENLKEQAANHERAGKSLTEELLAQLDSVNRQIDEQMAFITSLQQKKIDLRAQFNADLIRYRELKEN